MRCLLNKVAARRILEGLLKQTEARELSETENSALDLFERAADEGAQLYVAPLVATYDLPMIQPWQFQHEALRHHLWAMQCNLAPPYRHALLPQVLLPDRIDFSQLAN